MTIINHDVALSTHQLSLEFYIYAMPIHGSVCRNAPRVLHFSAFIIIVKWWWALAHSRSEVLRYYVGHLVRHTSRDVDGGGCYLRILIPLGWSLWWALIGRKHTTPPVPRPLMMMSYSCKFWYERSGLVHTRPTAAVEDVFSPSRVICDNSDDISRVPSNAFRYQPVSEFIDCSELRAVDLSLWGDCQGIYTHTLPLVGWWVLVQFLSLYHRYHIRPWASLSSHVICHWRAAAVERNCYRSLQNNVRW